MRLLICAFLALFLAFLLSFLTPMLLPMPAMAAEPYERTPPVIGAAGAILIEHKSGRVLFEQDADKQLPIASTTKVMTALITLEHADLTDTVVAGANASGVPGTSIYLSAGETLTVEQMLQGLMLRSGNDAAVALAEHVAGSVTEFSRWMNERAASLGADAHFTNPNGLDAKGHVASARALALIAREALDYPAFRALVATKRAVIPWAGNRYDRVLTNKNRLLRDYSGATGVKTGYTSKAGRCLVFSAERDGMELIGVLLNCGRWFEDAAALLDYGFDEFTMVDYLSPGEVVAHLPVAQGLEAEVTVVSPGKFSAAVGYHEPTELIIRTEERLSAPVVMGQVVGVAEVMLDGEVIAAQPLVAGQWVDRRTYQASLRHVIRHFNPVG